MQCRFSVLAVVLVWVGLCYVEASQGTCSVNAVVGDRFVYSAGRGGSNIVINVKITTMGTCSVTGVIVGVSLPFGATIIDYWNAEQLEKDKLYRVKNFGDKLEAGATFSGFGFTLVASAFTNPLLVANATCEAGCASNNTQPPLVSGRKYLDAEFMKKLQVASTEANRFELLSNEDFVFDFSTATTVVSDGTGGRTVAVTPDNFPAIIGHNIAMTVGFIGPCGINLPHTHPRATEINIIVKGKMQAGLLLENGVRFIGTVLHEGMATVFPQGAIHFEQNLNCEPSIFVAAFNNQDPGVQTTSVSFFGLPSDIVGASLNISSIQTVEDLGRFLPENPALGIFECRRRCGLD